MSDRERLKETCAQVEHMVDTAREAIEEAQDEPCSPAESALCRALVALADAVDTLQDAVREDPS